MGIREKKASNYVEFWEHHDCDTVCGYVTSMEKNAHPVVTPHTAGWKVENGKRIYFSEHMSGMRMNDPIISGIILRNWDIRYFVL